MLPSLEIKNFRMLEDFRVSKLGHVNLIVGKNNSGKSSVLEALRIYAGNANRGLLEKIAAEHNERTRPRDPQDGDAPFPFEELFTGRQFPNFGEKIIIGSTATDPAALSLGFGVRVETEETDPNGEQRTRTRLHPSAPSELDKWDGDVVAPCLLVTKGRGTAGLRLDESQPPRARPFEASGVPCSVIPTQFVSIDELANEWDKVALTDDQDTVREALRIVTPEFEGITFVRTDEGDPRAFRRAAIIKLSTFKQPVPLASLGDGMVRVLQLILKVFPAKGGFFLIDEFENGLHFSVQEKVWTLLFGLAKLLDVQIFATTHSWDCIESFAKIAVEKSDTKSVLFRMGRSIRKSDHGKIIATSFTGEELTAITQADVEVR
jgi:hypothetical protein